MRVTEQQENQAAAARSASSKFGQDKTHPFLINIEDGSLIPNTPHLRKVRSQKYRVYTGDIQASTEERMRYLNMGVGPRRARVVDSTAAGAKEDEPFDVGTASKDDLVAFAAMEYGFTLDSKKPLKTLKEEFMKLAKEFDQDLS